MVTLGAELQGPAWWLALADHFRLHWTLAGLVVVVLALHRAVMPLVVLATAVVVVNGWALRVPFVPEAAGGPASVRVVFSNVAVDNLDGTLPQVLLDAHQPDILAFAEVDERWQRILEVAFPDHPHRHFATRANNFGLGLVSRLPLEDVQVRGMDGDDAYPALLAAVRVGGEKVNLLVAHPHPPLNGYTSAMRDRQIASLATLRNSRPGPFVLLADLNTTPWSTPFQDLISATGLRDSRPGHGHQATWPAPLAAVGIPLDHVLVSPEWSVQSRRTGPPVGSDHLPVFASLALSQRNRGDALKRNTNATPHRERPVDSVPSGPFATLE